MASRRNWIVGAAVIAVAVIVYYLWFMPKWW